MLDTLNPALEWLNAHPQLSGLFTFCISAAESIAIIGTVIPGTIMMAAIGALAGVGVIPLWETLIWAILGAIVGDGISYWIGRKFNTRLPHVWPFRTYPALLRNGEEFFRNHGWTSVFIGRFVGPVRALVPMIAGMLGMSPLRFTVANVLSAIGWAPLYMLPGILLGAASLELPPDVATHVIITILASLFFIMLCFWAIRKLFILVSNQIDHSLNWLWQHLQRSHLRSVTQILKHHRSEKTHGQLVLAFYLILCVAALAYLTGYIFVTDSSQIVINTICFHFFRSLRSLQGDHIMLLIAFLGEKTVLLPLIITLFGYLAYRKQWRTAWHVLALGVLTAGGIEVIKLMVHSPRPWGLVHNRQSFSFPSGHTALAMTFYVGIAYLLIKAFRVRTQHYIYATAGIIIAAVCISRLYFGVHWLTDVMGGLLLGTAVLLFILISYNRQPAQPLNPAGVLITILLTLTITYSVEVYRHFNQFMQDYKKLDWPVYTVSLDRWWNQQGDHLPLYRINRFGLTGKILNLQWLGNLADIKAILLKNGWEVPPQHDWISALHRISDVNSTEHLPLVSPLYLDKEPVLVLIKQTNGNKKLIALRFWESNLIISGTKLPLWVGSVEAIPRTYSWLLPNKKNQLALTSNLLFLHSPTAYEIRIVTVQLSQKPRNVIEPMVLVKPRNIN